MNYLIITLAGYFGIWTPLTLILFLVGIGLLVIEMITPGVGVPGFLGAASIIIAIIAQFIQVSSADYIYVLITVMLALVILTVAMLVIFKTFSNGRISKTQIVLDTEAPAKAEEQTDLIGMHGVVLNDLRPSGFAMIDGRKTDVVTSGEFIAKDSEVVVCATEGKKIIVKCVEA